MTPRQCGTSTPKRVPSHRLAACAVRNSPRTQKIARGCTQTPTSAADQRCKLASSALPLPSNPCLHTPCCLPCLATYACCPLYLATGSYGLPRTVRDVEHVRRQDYAVLTVNVSIKGRSHTRVNEGSAHSIPFACLRVMLRRTPMGRTSPVVRRLRQHPSLALERHCTSGARLGLGASPPAHNSSEPHAACA